LTPRNAAGAKRVAIPTPSLAALFRPIPTLGASKPPPTEIAGASTAIANRPLCYARNLIADFANFLLWLQTGSTL
jgi:hypothetical protein